MNYKANSLNVIDMISLSIVTRLVISVFGLRMNICLLVLFVVL